MEFQEQSYRGAYYDLCDYLLGWTLQQYSENRAEYEALTEEEKESYSLMSAEVRDRAVSVIGLAVPLGMYTVCLFAVCVLLGVCRSFVRGRKS